MASKKFVDIFKYPTKNLSQFIATECMRIPHIRTSILATLDILLEKLQIQIVMRSSVW